MTASRGSAVLIPADAQHAPTQPGFEFLLVSSQAAYDRAVQWGEQAILPSARFSETDQRGALRRFLGPVNMAWRWRRYLLNEGITDITIPRLSAPAVPLLGGAILAGARVRLRHKA